MQKPAPTDYPVIEEIAQRWSPLAFSSRPVETERLRSLFEAARWAASSYNEQPWRYIVAQKSDDETYQKVLACLVEGNQAWAKYAPVLGLSVASTKFQRNQKPNRHAFHDVGQATAHLALEATKQGLYVHQMAGFDADQARSTFQIPEDFEPVAGFALGYPGSISDLSEDHQKREQADRARKPQADFVFGGDWGIAAEF
ncbi:Malonic semialdehyde reductase RutE [Planctomycetales bacterium 10988]|nr:Malonic semialdehyde reductase RutE [Planctomycetales bacterium 10988]